MKNSKSNSSETKTLVAAAAKEDAELNQASSGEAEAGADWLASEYIEAARQELAGKKGARRLSILRGLARDWAALRRGDHSAARFQLQREKLDLARANCEAQKEKEFRQWLNRPDIREELFPDKDRGLSLETIEKIERELNLL